MHLCQYRVYRGEMHQGLGLGSTGGAHVNTGSTGGDALGSTGGEGGHPCQHRVYRGRCTSRDAPGSRVYSGRGGAPVSTQGLQGEMHQGLGPTGGEGGTRVNTGSTGGDAPGSRAYRGRGGAPVSTQGLQGEMHQGLGSTGVEGGTRVNTGSTGGDAPGSMSRVYRGRCTRVYV